MDNTVGSLTQLQKDVIIGSILGDGYLRQLKGRKNAFLEINHSIKQKEYADWKYLILKNICKSNPKVRNSNGGRIACRFYTKQHPKLTELYNFFYENRKKIIPDNFVLNPSILAIWFMDDGSKCRISDVYLNTQQFNLKDHNKLINALKELGLIVKLNKDKEYYRLRFLKSSLFKLKALINDNVISSMKYKIEL